MKNQKTNNMKNIKSEYVWTIDNNDRITEPDIKIFKSWENTVNKIIYELEHSRGIGVKKMILNKYLHKDKLNWFTMNSEKKGEIHISPVPGYYGSYVILRKEKKEKKPIEKEKQIKLQNFNELMMGPEIDYNDFIIDALDLDSIPFLINGDFKISLKLRILMCDYLNDIKENLPDDIFDSEREILDNFYLWVKKKYR